MEYLDYLQILWDYLPYMLYAFSFFTLIPKSVKKIKTFADVNFEENRLKYHRCYGPDLCCHAAAKDWSSTTTLSKPRKVVRRVYNKSQSSVKIKDPDRSEESEPTEGIKRQVQVSAIQTQTNVNQIAKMFESGASAAANTRKINRVTPVPIIVPEIRMQPEEAEQRLQAAWNSLKHKKPNQNSLMSGTSATAKNISSKISQLLHQENIENSANLLNQMDMTREANDFFEQNDKELESVHQAFNYNAKALNAVSSSSSTLNGSSSTPSSASPSASASSTPPSSPLILRSQPSPIPPASSNFNFKTSFEDMFAAIARNAEQQENFIYSGCKSLSPVTSIDDILAQRRLSRPLSAYSISDLLNEEASSSMEEAYVENFLRVINKT